MHTLKSLHPTFSMCRKCNIVFIDVKMHISMFPQSDTNIISSTLGFNTFLKHRTVGTCISNSYGDKFNSPILVGNAHCQFTCQIGGTISVIGYWYW